MMTSLLVFDDKERIGKWVASLVGQMTSWGDYYAMGADLKGELAAGVVLNNFTPCSATVHLAVSKPTKLLSELLDHAFLYAFTTCKLRRLTGLVEAQNGKSLKIIKRLGFVEESVMREAGTDGQDIIVLVLWPENYRKGRLNGQK
jgi:RimJ/RimL family protein N-acetyltransferase